MLGRRPILCILTLFVSSSCLFASQWPPARPLPNSQRHVGLQPVLLNATPVPRRSASNPSWLPEVANSALQPGALLSYVSPSAWVRYRKFIDVASIVMLAQAIFILALLFQRARRRKANLRLGESEQRFRLMADTTPALIWMCDRKGDVTYLNDRRIEFTGRDISAGLADVWSAFVHPDDLQGVQLANTEALEQQKEYSKEYRLRRRDGVYRWMLDVAAVRSDRNGIFAGFIGSAVDITDQKLAREALAKISGRLIEAQEVERSRIARELHDDICQRLALLSMELEQANRNANGSGNSMKLEGIRPHCAEIASDVQPLSHKLHSSKLEYLGIVAAMRGFCREFCQQNDLKVNFVEEGVPSFLPQDISLSLFRVTQEALQNALKHSGVSLFSVRVQGLADEIQLEISDQGAGFDVKEAMQENGLGLVSMQERVHLVQGTLAIVSKVGIGTRILVRVPLVAGSRVPGTSIESARA